MTLYGAGGENPYRARQEFSSVQCEMFCHPDTQTPRAGRTRQAANEFPPGIFERSVRGTSHVTLYHLLFVMGHK